MDSSLAGDQEEPLLVDDVPPRMDGIQLLHNPRQILRQWADPSAQKGIGGYFLRPGETLSSIHTSAQLVSTMVQQQHKEKHINFREMDAALHALCTCTTESGACRIKQHFNNPAVVAALEKGSTKGPAISPLLKITTHIALHKIELPWVWILNTENDLADALS